MTERFGANSVWQKIEREFLEQKMNDCFSDEQF